MMHLAFIIIPDRTECYIVPIYPLSISLIVWLINTYINIKPSHEMIAMIILMIWLINPISRTIKTVFWKVKICYENLEYIDQNSD